MSIIDNEVIDSRDIIDRLDHLESDLEDSLFDLEFTQDEIDQARAAWMDENGHELETLRKFRDEFECCADWKYGLTIIRDDYWMAYVEETLIDCGYIGKDHPWWLAIDWEKTANNVAIDYTTAIIDGMTYYARG